MDYSKVLPLIEETFRKALEEKRYKFGFKKYQGLSNKVATGSLRDSIRVFKDKDDLLVVTFNDYGLNVAGGRFKGKKGVPINALIKWIKARGLKGRDKKGRFITNESFAFGIQKNIKENGIRPADWIEVGKNNLLQNEKLVNLIGEAAVKEIIKIIEEAV